MCRHQLWSCALLIYLVLKVSGGGVTCSGSHRGEGVGLTFKLSAFLLTCCSFHSTKTGGQSLLEVPTPGCEWAQSCRPDSTQTAQIHLLASKAVLCHWAPCMLAGAAKCRACSGQQRSPSTVGALLGHCCLPPWTLDSYKPLQVSINPPWLQLQCPPRRSLPAGGHWVHPWPQPFQPRLPLG